MKNKFLKAKHWQLFLALVGSALIFQIILIRIIFANMAPIATASSTPKMPDPRMIANIFSIFKLFPIILIVMMSILYGWQWSVATGLQNKLPEGITMKLKKFKIFFSFHVIYLLALSIVLPVFVEHMFTIALHNQVPNIPMIALSFIFIIPLHLFAIFCILYSMYFIAKTIKTVELQKEVTFSDFVGEFFMIWFFPIGIWFLQPRINRIVDNQNPPTIF